MNEIYNDKTKHGPYIPLFDKSQYIPLSSYYENSLYQELTKFGRKIPSPSDLRQYLLARARRQHERDRLKKLYPRAMQYQVKEIARIAVNTLDICIQKAFPNVQVLPYELKLEILKFVMPVIPPNICFKTNSHLHHSFEDPSKFILLDANVMRKFESEGVSSTVVPRENGWRPEKIDVLENGGIKKETEIKYSVDEAAPLLCNKITDHLLRECHVTRKIRFTISIRSANEWEWSLLYRNDPGPTFWGHLKRNIPERYSLNFLSVLEMVEEKLERYGYLVDRIAITENINNLLTDNDLFRLHSTFEIDVYYEP